MVYGEYIQSVSNLLAQKVVSLLPPRLNCCYFVNSGTEANEGALEAGQTLYRASRDCFLPKVIPWKHARFHERLRQ